MVAVIVFVASLKATVFTCAVVLPGYDVPPCNIAVAVSEFPFKDVACTSYHLSVVVPNVLFPLPGLIPVVTTSAILVTTLFTFTCKSIFVPTSFAITPSLPLAIAILRSFESPTVKPASANLATEVKFVEEACK